MREDRNVANGITPGIALALYQLFLAEYFPDGEGQSPRHRRRFFGRSAGRGRTIERTITLPVDLKQARIGIKPLFKGTDLDEKQTASFEVELTHNWFGARLFEASCTLGSKTAARRL